MRRHRDDTRGRYALGIERGHTGVGHTGDTALTANAPTFNGRVYNGASEDTAPQFRLTLADGRVLRSPDLVSAKLTVVTVTGIAKVQVAEEIVLYNACSRMMRADYGGRGTGTTRNGMLIDIDDADGIQMLELTDPKVDFEAGWTSADAVGVRHVRVKENTALAALEAAFPQLKGRTGVVFAEAFACSLGATLFNRWAP